MTNDHGDKPPDHNSLSWLARTRDSALACGARRMLEDLGYVPGKTPQARVIRDTVTGAMTWDGMLVVSPERDMVYTQEVIEAVERAMAEFGEVLEISPGRGGLMVQMDSLKLRTVTSLCVNGANWTVRPPGSAESDKVMREEAALFGFSDIGVTSGDRRPAPARPSAPPARPAPPAPRPSRPAPGIPGLEKLSLADQESDDEDGFVTCH